VTLFCIFFNSGLDDFSKLSAVAVTTGPGLAPCLNIGLQTAIDIAQTYKIDFVSVNHLEVHQAIDMVYNV